MSRAAERLGVVNFRVDLVYAWIGPRIRFR